MQQGLQKLKLTGAERLRSGTKSGDQSRAPSRHLIKLKAVQIKAAENHRFQEKDYLAVVRGAPARAWLRQQLARAGAPRTTNNIFLNATVL
jgi:hypothetical protein